MFEVVLGNGVIPIMLVILVLFAIGKGRRVLNTFVMAAINVSVHVGGVRVKMFPLLAFVNLTYIFSMLDKIHKMKKLHQGEEDHVHASHSGQNMEEMLLCYRNMILNICSIVLIFQVWVTGA